MLSRPAACISLAAALLCAPAAAHARDVVRPSSVEARTTVPAGGATTLTLECPTPAVALNAAVASHGAGVTVRRSIPGTGAGDWRFRLTAAAGADRRVARAVLRCVRLELPAGLSGASLDVKTRRESVVSIPAGGTAAVRLRCGPAWVATGYGFDDRRGRVRLATIEPSAHGWDFILENTGSRAAPAGVSARCLRQTVTATRGGGSAELRFRVARPAFQNRLGPGSTTFTHSCGSTQFSLATGSIVDALADIELGANGPVETRRGRWRFRRAAGGDEVRTFLVCLSRRSGFH
jgi:hypothetical protein